MRHERFSALWGRGTSGGETRRARRARTGVSLAAVVTAVAILPWSASAAGPTPGPQGGSTTGSAPQSSVFVTPELLTQAQASPQDSFAVIVQGDGSKSADHVAHEVAGWAAHANQQLTDAAHKADDALAQAQKQAADLAAKASKAQADAAAKASKAAAGGKDGDQKAAAKAAQDAADAQQLSDAAQAAVPQAQAADDAANAALSQLSDKILKQQVKDEFSSIAGVAVTLTGDEIVKLAQDGQGLLSITPDAPVSATGLSSVQATATDPGQQGPVLTPGTLLAQAQASPQDSFTVVVQGDGSKDADKAAHQVADWVVQANHQLTDAAHKADDALAKAQKQAADLAAKASKAQADATAKASKAAASGSDGDQKAAAKAAQDAADAQQLSDAAQAAVPQAQAADDAANAALSQLSDDALRQQIEDAFSSGSGTTVTLTGDEIAKLVQGGKGLVSITLAPTQAGGSSSSPPPPPTPTQTSDPSSDLLAPAPTKGGGWSSKQLWPYASGSAGLWNADGDLANKQQMPTIAIVDSGIESRSDFGNRIVASVNLSSVDPSPGDSRGHGTFVAGIAAGGAKDYAGANPSVDLVDVKAMGSDGSGMTSDVIRACQWILDNQARYDIRVANFSLHSDISAPFYLDPLDRAVEQLWFHGIVVVTAAGNYGSSSGPSGVLYSPGDDPFVITVGAVDLNNSKDVKRHTIAPWSAWGYTIDGFAKPELSAPGRYMIGPVPTNATLVGDHPGNVVAPGYMELSGTSFAAPVVSAAAATLLARHPDFTPDEVKGALMLSAKPLPAVGTAAGGVGEIAADKAVGAGSAPNPNAALEQFVTTDTSGGTTAYGFDAASWDNTAQANASWNSASWSSASWSSASWNSASWNSASWGSASWSSASWNSASWNSASWSSASWNSASWSSASHTDGAAGDFVPADQVTLSPADENAQVAAAAAAGP